MERKPISFRIDPENKAKLNALSKRNNLDVSKLLNKMISEHNLTSKNPLLSKVEESNISGRIKDLEKEFLVQRQRINIFKNQIDFLIKSKNGKRIPTKPPKDY